MNDFDITQNYTVTLNEGIEVEQLIEKFRTYLKFDLLMAYMNKEVVEKGLLVPLGLSHEAGYQKKNK